MYCAEHKLHCSWCMYLRILGSWTCIRFVIDILNPNSYRFLWIRLFYSLTFGRGRILVVSFVLCVYGIYYHFLGLTSFCFRLGSCWNTTFVVYLGDCLCTERPAYLPVVSICKIALNFLCMPWCHKWNFFSLYLWPSYSSDLYVFWSQSMTKDTVRLPDGSTIMLLLFFRDTMHVIAQNIVYHTI